MNWELDALCDDFEAALERGERPAISDWAKSDAAIPELAALELHHRLIAGEVVTAADYFAMYPQLLANREVAVRLVGVEYRAAVSRDYCINELHFRERYPDLANGQEWSNGPWVSDTAVVAGTGTLIQQLPPKAPSVPTAKIDLPDYLANILQSPFAEHPNDLGRLSEYRILALLGRGGMGAVLKGANVHSGHPAALKVMLPGEAVHGRDRFLREARAAQKIDHPRVVPIYHVGEADGVPYIAMKLLEGQSLKDRMCSEPPLTMPEIVRIGREIAEGLDAAHKLKLVHRDLKPDNIWLESGPDGGEHVRILDFGLARPIGDAAIDGVASYTKTGVLVGTPAYMSPEQADGQAVDARTDLWSLGVVLYRMATMKYPFGHEPILKVLTAIANDTPKPLHELNPEVPLRLSKLVAKLLEKNADRRPVDAREVIQELNRVWDGDIGSEMTVTFVGKPSASKPFPGRAKFFSYSMTIAISLCVLVVLGLSLSLKNSKPDVASRPPLDDDPILVPKDMPVAVSQPLTVKFISLQHFANKTPKNAVPEVEPRGILGKESFDVAFGDVLKVEVELTRSAYCYVVAFRPDGVAECIYPEPADADTPPELTDRPRYPSKTRGEYYAITDGTGLWVFGVVASPKPLPAFTKAIAGKTIPKLAGGPSPANTVFWDDGKWVETLTKAGTDRGARGAGVKVQGPGAVTAAADWLKKLTDDKDAVSAAIGFVVNVRD